MSDLFVLTAIIIWPVIPLFWVPVHGLPKLSKRLGLYSYAIPAVLWPPIAYYLFSNRDMILLQRTGLPLIIKLFGILIAVLGAGLQVWTIRLLGFRGITGMPEVSARIEGKFVVTGPFKVVRHPTYLSHTLMFLGLFLISGIYAIGIVAILDLLIVVFVIIPLEDRELSERFGSIYDEYRRKVPAFYYFIRTDKKR